MTLIALIAWIVVMPLMVGWIVMSVGGLETFHRMALYWVAGLVMLAGLLPVILRRLGH